MKSEMIGAGAMDAARPLPHDSGASRAGLRSLANFHLFFLAALFFILPNAIFATALRPLPAALVWVGCAGAGALLWRARQASRLLCAPLDLPRLALCLGFGAALCLLGGEGHFFYATRDWLIRDAVLHDLVTNGLTVLYRYEGQDYLLRAPLGMYMIPAMAGRLLGLYAGHMALLAQNTLILGAILYFTSLVAAVRTAPMLLLFMGFSGLDILPILVAEAVEMAKGGDFMPFAHIEWWGEYYSSIRLQYSSHITQLFWVPNHMAPGWWFALLALLYARGEIQMPALLVSCATMLIWSPLSMMGAAPFVAYFALQLPLRNIFARETVIAAAIGLCFLPVALYLTMDAGAVPHEWLILRDSFALRYVLFILIEIPQVAVIFYAWNKVEPSDRKILILAIALLLIIPVYSVGVSNDFVMRVSIPAMFLLAFSFARIAVLTPRDNGAFATAISVIVIVSATTPLLELKQAFKERYAISDCNMLTSWHKGDISALPTNYWARIEKTPDWLMTAESAPAPFTLEDRLCWPDHPYFDGDRK